jgi:hypothetical protein
MPRGLTYANVMSSLALFVALGGVSVAATQLPKASVGNAQLKNSAVTHTKVKDGSLVAADFRVGELPEGIQGERGYEGPRGERGLQGERGPQGPQGEQGLPGAQGLRGEQGIAGPAGATGSQGSQGPQGPQGPVGPGQATYFKQMAPPDEPLFTTSISVPLEFGPLRLPAGSFVVTTTFYGFSDNGSAATCRMMADSDASNSPEVRAVATGSAILGTLTWARTWSSATNVKLSCFYYRGGYTSGLQLSSISLTATKVGSIDLQ